MSLALTYSSAPPLGSLTPSVASEGVVEPLVLVHVIQYSTHRWLYVNTYKYCGLQLFVCDNSLYGYVHSCPF